MDSQLYLWARKQEIEHELARRALVSEAKALRARDGAGRKFLMFGIKRHLRATTPTEEEERQRAPVISDSPAGAQENGNGRAWHWRVEPGMEDAFQDLLGWMLPSQRGAEVATAPTQPEPSPSEAIEQRPAAQPTALETCERRPASELRPLTA